MVNSGNIKSGNKINYTISPDNHKKYQSRNFLVKFLLNNFYATIYELMEKCLPIENLIDIGCGEGFDIYNMRQRFAGKNFSIVGADINEESLRECQKLNPGILLFKEDVYALSFPAKSFDLVVCLETLEHLESPEIALTELCRIGKKHILLSVPNEPIFSFSNLIRGKNIKNLGRSPEHLQFWNTKRFVKFISPKIRIKTIKKSFPWVIILGEII